MNIPRGNVMAAVENIINGSAKPVDIGQFNGENFIYIASFGNFTSSSYTASQKLKNAIGRTAYYLPIVKEFFHMKGFYARVEADGETFEGDWFVGGATNSYGVGGMPVLHNIGVEFTMQNLISDCISPLKNLICRQLCKSCSLEISGLHR